MNTTVSPRAANVVRAIRAGSISTSDLDELRGACRAAGAQFSATIGDRAVRADAPTDSELAALIEKYKGRAGSAEVVREIIRRANEEWVQQRGRGLKLSLPEYVEIQLQKAGIRMPAPPPPDSPAPYAAIDVALSASVPAATMVALPPPDRELESLAVKFGAVDNLGRYDVVRRALVEWREGRVRGLTVPRDRYIAMALELDESAVKFSVIHPEDAKRERIRTIASTPTPSKRDSELNDMLLKFAPRIALQPQGPAIVERAVAEWREQRTRGLSVPLDKYVEQALQRAEDADYRVRNG